MWSGVGAAGVAGAMSIGGSLLGSALNRDFAEDAADEAFARQLYLLQNQQRFAERMSNTAHRREVIDLLAAGLNPILSATGGQGASTPAVSAPSVQQASGVDYGDLGFGKAGDAIGRSSAFALAKNQAAEVKKNSESQRALNDANAGSAKAQAELMRKQTEKIELEKDLVRAQTKDANATHLYKMPGHISSELVKYLQSKFPGSSSKSRGSVVPDDSWNRINDPNYYSLNNSPSI